MKKSLLNVILLFAALISLAGCSGEKAPGTLVSVKSQTSSSSLEQQQESEEDSYEADTSAPLQLVQQQPSENTGDVFVIKDKMFITQCNDIYLNPDDYKNKTIWVEGIYDEYTDPDTNETYCYIIRNGPGCCGNDGVAGFEIKYEGEHPKRNDWIQVTGTVEVEKVKELENDNEYDKVILQLSKLEISDIRGAEYVEN